MVAFLVISTHLGGAERSLLDLLVSLKKRKKYFLVITPKTTGPLIDELQSNDIEFISLNIPKWYLGISRNKPLQMAVCALPAGLMSCWLLAKIILIVRRHKIDSIHSTGLKFHVLLGFLGKLSRDTHICIHLRDIIYNRQLKALLAYFSKNQNITIISNSIVTADSIEPTNSKIIYNGFKIPERKLSNLKTQLGLSTDQKLIGMVGAIARWKGQREFIRMAAQINQRHSDWNFVIVGSEIYDTKGDRGELETLKAMAGDFGLNDKLHFLEFQKDISNVYFGLDALIHTSIKPEPFGRVIVEAMYHGCPVIAPRQGGPIEIIQNEDCGLLYTPSDLQDMIGKLCQLMDSPKKYSDIRRKAFLRALDFSLDRHTSSIENLLFPQGPVSTKQIL